MLKERRQLMEFVFMCFDLIVVILAWLAAYWLRFNTDFVEQDKGIPALGNYISLILFVLPIWAYVFRRFGLYRPMRGTRRGRELWALINANTVAVIIFITTTYLFREKDVPYSRLVFIYFGVLAIFFTALERGALRALLREVRRRGYNLRYMLVVGAGKVAGDIITRVRMHPEIGVQLIGCLSRDGSELKGPRGLPIIGKYSDLERLLSTKAIDQVMVALPMEDSTHLPEVMTQTANSVVDVRIIPDIYQFINLGGTIQEFEGLPVVSLQEAPMGGAGLAMKRCFDLLVSAVIVLLISPLLVTIALLIKCTSRGPIFYSQERVSVDGSSFKIYKFRSMACDAEKSGPQWTKPNDGRVTGLGRFMRSTSLDELPQLLNVLKGDMSLVGPRPERPVFIEEFRKRVPKYMLRHKVPAGITGWAQVNGWRGDTSIDKRIEYDLHYIENWSVLFDCKIILLTLLRGFKQPNAY